MKIRDYISTWSDNYQAIFHKSRLLSQIPIFIIAVIGFFYVGEAFYAISKTDNLAPEFDFYWKLKLILMPVLFLARFFLLFSKSKTSFWISQLIWLFYFVLIWNDFNSYGYYHLKLEEAFVFLYMPCSFVRQVISLILSFFFHRLKTS